MWKGNGQVFRGYAIGSNDGDGKKPVMKVKGKDLLPWCAVEGCKSFGAILNKDYVDVSFDTEEMSNKFIEMVKVNNWNCLILRNPKNGHVHSYWRNSKKRIDKDGHDIKVAVGFIADIHSGSTYIPLKVLGVERFPPIAEPYEIDEVPEELIPVNTQIDLMNLKDGQGRNEELFKYILILQSQLMISKDVIRRILENINNFTFHEPLSSKELETISRDEAFEKPIFFNGKSFLHDQFSRYMVQEYHIKRINGQLCTYHDGIYKSGYKIIESQMIDVIPAIKASQRAEALKFIEIMIPEDTEPSDGRLIAFRNGVYDMATDSLLPFSPEYVITNKIDWDYNPSAYSEIGDSVMNKFACGDAEIRSILEEAIGYSFFRQNELSKSFILTGDGSNGKSTYLDLCKFVLGRKNYVALDMDELSERFTVSTMYGKLAVFGDDSNDEYMQGKVLSNFKKIVSGNDLKGENKGQDLFFFKPYTKLFFSFNSIPRMKNKGFYALKRRMVIIPFNARFSKSDPDYDPNIIWKLRTQGVAEYLVRLGIEGLKRVQENRDFTQSSKVNSEVEQFEKDNNPIISFLETIEEKEVEIIGRPTKEVFLRYETFCYENGYQRIAMQSFTKEINKLLNCGVKQKRDGAFRGRIFTRE